MHNERTGAATPPPSGWQARFATEALDRISRQIDEILDLATEARDADPELAAGLEQVAAAFAGHVLNALGITRR